MTDLEKIAFKEKLRSQCIALIEERMQLAAEAMQQAQDAANAEEKSSAGDKYETGRAMNHIQKDLHARHGLEVELRDRLGDGGREQELLSRRPGWIGYATGCAAGRKQERKSRENRPRGEHLCSGH